MIGRGRSKAIVTLSREVATTLAEWERGRLDRRSLLRRAALLGMSGPALAMLVGRDGPPRASAAVLQALQDDPSAGTPGGTLRVATIGEPPHLDEHQSTAEIIAVIGYCAYEGLFTYDDQYQPIPELVETYTVSDDGLTHTMALRQGVVFHNGEELTAADAIASVERWGRISGVGKRLMEKTNELAQVDDSTLEFRLSEPYGTILIALAHNTQACTIHPKSILDAAGDDPMTDPAQYVGTGPYRLAEWQRDAAMRFERFDDYQSAPGDKPIGYGGKKYAYADVIEFIPGPGRGGAGGRVAGGRLPARPRHRQRPVPRAARISGDRRGDPHADELGRLLPQLEVADDGEPGDAAGGAGRLRPHRRCCSRAAAAMSSSGSIPG